MKKLVALLLIWNASLSGVAVYLYASQPEPINRTVTYQVNKLGQDGKTPIKGVDYKDGETLPAIQPKDGVDGKDAIAKDGKDGINGLSAYQIAQSYGYTGSEEEWINSLVPEKPYLETRCNPVIGKFEHRESPVGLWKPYNNSKCVV